MKILHIFPRGKSQVNGITNVVLNLSFAQSKTNNDIFIGFVDFSNRESLDEQRKIFDLSDIDKFQNCINSNKIDIVIFHSLYYLKYLKYYKLLMKLKKPYAITFHGGASKDNYKKHFIKKFIANKLFFNDFVKKASRVIYLNESEKNKSIFKNINTKYGIIPNGVEYPLIDCKGKFEEKIEIIFLGRMDYYGKGLDVLYRVVKKLFNSSYKNIIKFSFYGFKYDETVNIWKEFGDFAKYYGPVYGKEKVNALLRGNIMILPSRSEGMPLNILEGFSYGLPAIVTPETNVNDIIEEYRVGWVSELNDDCLYNTIKQACLDYKRNKNYYFEKCRKVASLFRWEEVAKKSIKLYKEIIDVQK